ncbi:MAG: SMP-30/gluconolactonase/LRE family protein [Sedimentisphaerales bacterium]|nr:SMP-30/gluconolactonase/LRE family protein [Sedimentisphaerales bacterium]
MSDRKIKTIKAIGSAALAAAMLLGFGAAAGAADSLLAPQAKVAKLAEGFRFTEGPAVDAAGDIYFTDIPNNRILKWSFADGKLTTFRENSGGANGLFFDGEGNLLVCEGGGRRLAAVDPQGEAVALATTYQDKRFNSCNDLWVAPNGGVYFTDPRYGSRDGMEIGGEHVYYLAPDRKTVARVVDDMVRPNGVIGTRDGKYLYVTDNGAGKTYRYAINPDGTLTDKKLFVDEGSDGMTIDTDGNVYLTNDGVRVFDPQGKNIETIAFPEQPANVTFGGPDRHTIVVTARTGLYSVRMNAGGYPAWQLARRAGQSIPPGYRLAYAQDFDAADALAGFEFTDPDKWQFSPQGNGGGALEFLGSGAYQPKVRSPLIIGLIGDRQMGDFILEADLLQTGRQYGHRDMCLFFGLQNPGQFYYVHFASQADPHAHNIFKVDNEPRIAIAQKTTDGVNWWQDVWHRVRLERRLAEGTIRVYFDDLQVPIMTAKDTTFGAGYVGFGSFDDSGRIDNVRIWSPQVTQKKAGFYRTK